MRKVGGYTPYYNVDEGYIRGHIEDYLYDWVYDQERLEPRVIIDPKNPRGDEYGGFWFKKGYNSQKGLIGFYRKFGFYHEPKVHLDWNYYSDTPLPSMICNL